MAESNTTNGFVYTGSQNRLFQLIKRSSNPLSTVRELIKSGVRLKHLNDHEDIGALLCEVILHNYGLGIRTLLDCGLNLSIEDSKNGDTPLLLVCAEGLCGPTSKLLDQLPPTALLHSNHLGSTPLKLLLVRSHGPCGCVQKLLNRLPICELLLPKEIATLFRQLSRGSTDSLSDTNFSLWTCQQCPASTVDCVSIPPDEEMFHNSHALLMPVSFLLNKIRSNDPDRILSVLQTWIEGNFLFVHHACKVEHENNWSAVKIRLIEVVYEQVQKGQFETGLLKNLLWAVIQLTIINQLKATHVTEYSLSYAGISEFFSRFGQQFTRHIDGAVLPLRFLTLQRIRHILQVRFIHCCLHPDAQNRTGQHPGAMIFVHWINSLNCLPPCIKSTLLLSAKTRLPISW